MCIYRGKLDFWLSGSKHATNEGITIMFPSGSEFHSGDPVYTCWQWSTSGNSTNVPCWLTGTIDLAPSSDTDGKEIGFYYGSDYRFNGTFSSEGIGSLSLMVESGTVLGTAIDIKLVTRPLAHPRSIIDPAPRIYIGKLSNWAPYSVDQLLLVVIPGGIVGEGNEICAFWQWTVDGAGKKKSNVDAASLSMTNVMNVANRALFNFTPGYYTFRAILNLKETAGQQHLTLTMTNPSNESTGPLTLELQDLGPPPSQRQPRGINNRTTVVTNDTNRIVGSSQNKVPSLMHHPLVEKDSKVVEINEHQSEHETDVLKQAVRERDGTIARLESSPQAAQDQDDAKLSGD